MIFYFTGTGNSLYAAKMLDRKVISIPQILNTENLLFEADKIGIVCPIYGHEIPAMVKEFLRKATFHTAYLYAVLTYGNRHASAVELAAELFKNVGKNVDYITTLLMVDNFLPAFDMEEQTKLNKTVEQQLAGIKADIAAQKREWKKVTPQDRAAHEGYLALVNHQPETVWAKFRVTNDCVGCGNCTKVCPAGRIYLENQKAVHTGDNCQACLACVHACLKAAIQMGMPEKNPNAQYRNEHIALSEIVAANNRTHS